MYFGDKNEDLESAIDVSLKETYKSLSDLGSAIHHLGRFWGDESRRVSRADGWGSTQCHSLRQRPICVLRVVKGVLASCQVSP